MKRNRNFIWNEKKEKPSGAFDRRDASPLLSAGFSAMLSLCCACSAKKTPVEYEAPSPVGTRAEMSVQQALSDDAATQKSQGEEGPNPEQINLDVTVKTVSPFEIECVRNYMNVNHPTLRGAIELRIKNNAPHKVLLAHLDPAGIRMRRIAPNEGKFFSLVHNCEPGFLLFPWDKDKAREANSGTAVHEGDWSLEGGEAVFLEPEETKIFVMNQWGCEGGPYRPSDWQEELAPGTYEITYRIHEIEPSPSFDTGISPVHVAKRVEGDGRVVYSQEFQGRKREVHMEEAAKEEGPVETKAVQENELPWDVDWEARKLRVETLLNSESFWSRSRSANRIVVQITATQYPCP